MFHVAVIFENLQRKGRGGKRKTEPATTLPRQSISPAHHAIAASALPVTSTCASPSPRMSRRICQMRDGLSSSPMMKSRKTTPSSETLKMSFRIRDQMQERSDDDAGHEIAEHSPKAQLAENRRRNDRTGQKQQGFGKESVVLGHGGGLSNKAATTRC